jgi:hypothetical protein
VSHMPDFASMVCHGIPACVCVGIQAHVCGRYMLDSVADNNRRYLVDRHIQAAAAVEALLDEP